MRFEAMKEYVTWDEALSDPMALNAEFKSIFEEMSQRYCMLCEIALRRLVARVIGKGCPSSSEDMMTILEARGLKCTLMYPPHPANNFAVVTKGESIIDREEMPRKPWYRDYSATAPAAQ